MGGSTERAEVMAACLSRLRSPMLAGFGTGRRSIYSAEVSPVQRPSLSTFDNNINSTRNVWPLEHMVVHYHSQS